MEPKAAAAVVVVITAAVVDVVRLLLVQYKTAVAAVDLVITIHHALLWSKLLMAKMVLPVRQIPAAVPAHST